MLSGADEALGYLAMMVPATYAQLRGAMAMAADRIPGWRPESLLDIGTGPGTAMWAAIAQWPTLEKIVGTDREPALLALGRVLAGESSSLANRRVTWTTSDVRHLAVAQDSRFDLVVIGHVLNELPSAARAGVVRRAWQATGGLLIVVEPGTPDGFEVVRRARDQMRGDGGYTIAPCAHEGPCPLVDDWCHFPQRITRPAFQRRARGAPGQWEDAKFSLAAMARFPAPDPIWGRAIREPRANKARAELHVSSGAGIVRAEAQKRERDAFLDVRDTAWGDPLPHPFADPIRMTVTQPVPEDTGSQPDGQE